MYAGSIEDDIKQLRMIQRACRRFGLEYAEFPECDSDGFFPGQWYHSLRVAENKSHSSCECCPSCCRPGPHYTCHYSRRVNCPANHPAPVGTAAFCLCPPSSKSPSNNVPAGPQTGGLLCVKHVHANSLITDLRANP
jgi:hypothetical protein